MIFFFFSSRRRHTRSKRDWSQTCALPISIPSITAASGSWYGTGEWGSDAGDRAHRLRAARVCVECALSETDRKTPAAEPASGDHFPTFLGMVMGRDGIDPRSTDHGSHEDHLR